MIVLLGVYDALINDDADMSTLANALQCHSNLSDHTITCKPDRRHNTGDMVMTPQMSPSYFRERGCHLFLVSAADGIDMAGGIGVILMIPLDSDNMAAINAALEATKIVET